MRSVLIRAHGEGLIANTLNFDYEVRSADEAFGELPAAKADDEMLDLALHIIKKKAGQFDPTKFDDRYDAALQELMKAKMEGRKITPPKAPEPTKRLRSAGGVAAERRGRRGNRHGKTQTAARKTAANENQEAEKSGLGRLPEALAAATSARRHPSFRMRSQYAN